MDSAVIAEAGLMVFFLKLFSRYNYLNWVIGTSKNRYKARFVSAHGEARSIKSFTGMNWQKHFSNFERQLLKTTLFDNALTPSKGNADVLPSYLRAFNRRHPQFYAQRAARFHGCLKRHPRMRMETAKKPRQPSWKQRLRKNAFEALIRNRQSSP